MQTRCDVGGEGTSAFVGATPQPSNWNNLRVEGYLASEFYTVYPVRDKYKIRA
ncbi:hypothetical protein bcgnr5402_55410 [Bacillus cereus]